MAGTLQASPTYELQPAAQKVTLATNYVSDFNYINQYLPDTQEAAEFERYGDRRVAGFMQMTGAELPSESDLIKWTEQGRLHVKYTQVGVASSTNADEPTFQVNDTLDPARGSIGLTAGTIALRVGQNVLISNNDGSGAYKGIVTDTDATSGTGLTAGQFKVAFYNADGYTGGSGVGNADVSVMIYGSEFGKGQGGMDGSLEANPNIFDNKPVIMKDKYSVNGSDMAQIGWIEVSMEGGQSGYLWYLKSEHETRLRFDDYLETKMIEDVPVEAGSGAASATATGSIEGSEGVFYSVSTGGNVYSGGIAENLSDWDSILQRLDKQGSIQENAVFVNRAFDLSIDDMLAAQNSYGAGGTSYGMFSNSESMALSLGFQGFRRGSYDFYKSSWKYLNDPTMRGDLASGAINGLLVPAGTTSVYDQALGKNVKRPFLHVRYRANERENRRYKSWVIAGDIGGVANTDIDKMEMQFLSERCVCTLGRNNFVLFEQ